MKRPAMAALGAWMVGALWASLALAEPASTDRAITGLSSNKSRGSVNIAIDPALDKGRLVMNVTGFNRTDQPVPLTDGDVKIFTAAGKSVGVIKLDRLIAEAEDDTFRRPERNDPLDDRLDPRNDDPLSRTRRPEPSGGMETDSTIGGTTARTRQSPTGESSSVSVGAGRLNNRANVEALKAVLLEAEVVQPSGAAGGKVVTEKLRFGRKDERALRVQVNFAGEQHEFTFVPPER